MFQSTSRFVGTILLYGFATTSTATAQTEFLTAPSALLGQTDQVVPANQPEPQNTLAVLPPSDILTALERQSQRVTTIGRPCCVAIRKVRREAETSLYWNETFGGAAAFGEALSIPILAPKPTDPDFLPTQYGSGIILDANAGLILTAASLIDAEVAAFDYYVTFSQIASASPQIVPASEPTSSASPTTPTEASLSAESSENRVISHTFATSVVGRDPRSGLAVLRAVSASGEPISLVEYGGLSIPLPVAENSIADGSLVVVLGNPLAVGRDGQLSVSLGTLSNHGRRASPEPTVDQPSGKQTLAQYGTLWTTDIPFIMGREGGPLFDLSGRFLGVVSAPAPLPGVAAMETSAIPVDSVFQRAVHALREGCEVGYGVLGVEMKNTDVHTVRIHRVLSGVPAQSAGIQVDDQIVALDGQAVSDADSVVKRLASYAPDATVRLTIERVNPPTSEGQTPSSQRLDIAVPLIQLPVSGQIITQRSLWRGIEVTATTIVNPSILRGLGRYYAGAAIAQIAENSPASQAGFQRGMLITGVAISKNIDTASETAALTTFEEVRTREDFERLVRTIPADATVIVRLAAENDQTLFKTLGP